MFYTQVLCCLRAFPSGRVFVYSEFPFLALQAFSLRLSGVVSSVLDLDYLPLGIVVSPSCFVLPCGQGPSRLEFFFGFGSSIYVGLLRSTVGLLPSLGSV